ncbi:MAG TPA: hypothetical protein VMM76_07610 [Pirellulaceae bacterium]|nr:hypothetical protein [Pirellulaceae bacterium]
MTTHPTVHRAAYTLVELTIAMSLGTVLVVGLASALLISAEGYRGNHGAQQRSTAAQVQADMLSDLQQATSFTTKTATSVAFKVPDRNGDSKEESIAYDWNSGTKTLTYSYGGGTAQTLLTDVTAFNFDYLTRSYSGTYPALPSLDPSLWGTRFGVVSFKGFSEAKTPQKAKFLFIDLPSGTENGDLLVAAAALDDNVKNKLLANGMFMHDTSTGVSYPWNAIAIDCSNNKVTIGVWWIITSSAYTPASVPRCFWDHDTEAYAWIMRFTGHDPVNPINASAVQMTDENITFTPTSPAVTTTVDDALILRLGAFDEDDYLLVDQPGLLGHTAITMDTNGDGRVSGGAGYIDQKEAGDSGTSTFSLIDREETITVTIAIAP